MKLIFLFLMQTPVKYRNKFLLIKLMFKIEYSIKCVFQSSSYPSLEGKPVPESEYQQKQ